MAERENPIHARSKRLITDALFDLMKTEPYDHITVREISEKAGLTRQTFYHNFTSKDEVIAYRTDKLFDGFIEFIAGRQITDVGSILRFYFSYWQENVEMYQCLLKNNLTHILLRKYPEYFRKVNFLRIDSSELEPVQIEYIYSYMTGAVINVLSTWIATGREDSPRELADIVLDIMHGKYFYDVVPLQNPEEK
jgi:AcrR family transcriptional regulator